jgi:hypothetical protein
MCSRDTALDVVSTHAMRAKTWSEFVRFVSGEAVIKVVGTLVAFDVMQGHRFADPVTFSSFILP